MHRHEHSWPQCVFLQGIQYSHILLHTSVLLTHMISFASTRNMLFVYLPWFDPGTHCSLLLMTGDVRAGVNRFVDMNQVSVMYQTVLWHVSATSIFAKTVEHTLIQTASTYSENSTTLQNSTAAKKAPQLSFAEHPVL